MSIEHEYVLNKFALSMNNIGWKRTKKQHNSIIGITDVILKKNNQTLYAEIKPIISLSDIWSGIGETLRVLVEPDENVLSILVCPEELSSIAKDIFSILNSKRIGLITFDKDITNFKIIISCWNEKENTITVIDEETMFKYEKREKINQIKLLRKLFSIEPEKREIIIECEKLLNIVKEEYFIENKKELTLQMGKFGLKCLNFLEKDSKSGIDIKKRGYRFSKKYIKDILESYEMSMDIQYNNFIKESL